MRVKGVKLVLLNDSRFIDTVISSYTVRRCFKKCARDILGMYPFPLHIKGVGNAKKYKNEKNEVQLLLNKTERALKQQNETRQVSFKSI